MNTVESLPDEHTVLRRQVTARATAVLHEADAGCWPGRALTELVDYLHLEVLRQLADEEWLLFRLTRHAPDELARLRRDHLELRLSVDTLTQAAARQGLTPAQLAATVRDMLAQLNAHLTAEEQTLAGTGPVAPSTASRGAQPHEWYPLTEGPVIDLDRLPGPLGADAALDRLRRLRPGERVEVHASTVPGPLWRHLWRTDPTGWRVTSLEPGPPHWRIEITRRPGG